MDRGGARARTESGALEISQHAMVDAGKKVEELKEVYDRSRAFLAELEANLPTPLELPSVYSFRGSEAGGRPATSRQGSLVADTEEFRKLGERALSRRPSMRVSHVNISFGRCDPTYDSDDSEGKKSPTASGAASGPAPGSRRLQSLIASSNPGALSPLPRASETNAPGLTRSSRSFVQPRASETNVPDMPQSRRPSITGTATSPMVGGGPLTAQRRASSLNVHGFVTYRRMSNILSQVAVPDDADGSPPAAPAPRVPHGVQLPPLLTGAARSDVQAWAHAVSPSPAGLSASNPLLSAPGASASRGMLAGRSMRVLSLTTHGGEGEPLLPRKPRALVSAAGNDSAHRMCWAGDIAEDS